MLTRAMRLPGGGPTTSRPSMLMPTRIHVAYLGPTPYRSGPTWQHIKITQNSHLAFYSRQDECAQDMFGLAKPEIFLSIYPEGRSVKNLYLSYVRRTRALFSRAWTHCLEIILNFQFLLGTEKAVFIRQREIHKIPFMAYPDTFTLNRNALRGRRSRGISMIISQLFFLCGFHGFLFCRAFQICFLLWNALMHILL